MALHRLVIIGIEDHLVTDAQRIAVGSVMDVAGDNIKFFSQDTDVKKVVSESFNVESKKVYFGEQSEILLLSNTPQAQILKFRTLGRNVKALVIKEGIQAVPSLDGMTENLISRWLNGEKITEEDMRKSRASFETSDDDSDEDDISQIFALLEDDDDDEQDVESHESSEVVLGPSSELDPDEVQSFVPGGETKIPDADQDDDLGFDQVPEEVAATENERLSDILSGMNPDEEDYEPAPIPAPQTDPVADDEPDDSDSDDDPLGFLMDNGEEDHSDDEVEEGRVSESIAPVDKPRHIEEYESVPEPEQKRVPVSDLVGNSSKTVTDEADEPVDDDDEVGFEPTPATPVTDPSDDSVTGGNQNTDLSDFNQEQLFDKSDRDTTVERRAASNVMETEEDDQGYISVPMAEDALSIENAHKQREFLRNKALYADSIDPSNRIGNRGRIILVTSGKGGNMKSTVSWAMWAGLAQARAQSGESDKQTWLIETDYNSPLLKYVMPEIRDGQDLGGLARMIMRASEESHTNINNQHLLEAIIREFSYVDERTGGRVIVAPIGASNVPENYFKTAIVLAARAISESGGAVILDGGTFDIRSSQDVEIPLAYNIAHHTILSTTPGSAGPTRQLARTLTSPSGSGTVPFQPLQKSQVRVILSQASRDVADRLVNEFFPPISVDAVIPQIPDLLPGNCQVSEHGVSHISLESPNVQEAVILRASRLLVACGYTDYEKYFTPRVLGATSSNESNRKMTIGERIAGIFSRN